VAVLGLGLFSGCGAAADADTQETTPAEPTEAAEAAATPPEEAEHEPLTIVTAQVNYSTFVQALAQVYPEIRLELSSYKGGNTSTYLQWTLENGDIPDIYATNYLVDEALQEEYLIDLSGYDFVNSYTDTMLNRVDVDGAVYLLPSRYTVAGLNYNKTLFEQYGWEVPRTFDELLALADQIRQEAPDVTPVKASMNLPGHAFQYLFAINNSSFFSTPAGSKWKEDFLNGQATAVGNLEGCLENMQRWIDAGFLTAEEDNLLDGSWMSDFYDGKVAICMNIATSRWQGVGKTTGETIDVGLMPWPAMDEGDDPMLLTNISRYYGLNKSLLEPGNEQKLEDALKVMAFMSTEEGQAALAAGATNGVAYPFKDFQVEEDDPLYDVHDLIEDGYTEALTYEVWSDHLLVPMSQELVGFIQGTEPAQTVLESFDAMNQAYRDDPESDVTAWCDEDMTMEENARLVGMAMIQYTGADVALVSLGGIVDDCYENSSGVPCGIYAGPIRGEQDINIFRPFGTSMATVALTGAEIQQMLADGRYYDVEPGTYAQRPDETEWVHYAMPYVLTVRNDADLEPEQTYTVVFSTGDYATDLAEAWGEALVLTENASDLDAIAAWFEAQPEHHFSAASLVW
jgi:ABC-type glycerol-3-phosphate transport system substrate-binding protein